jgi:hypothetical protein
MNRRRAVATFIVMVMAGFLFGGSAQSLAAERTVVLRTPGCV